MFQRLMHIRAHYIFLTFILTGNVAFATPKQIVGLDKQRIVSGQSGGTYTLLLGDSPPSLFYYGAIDRHLNAISQQMFDALVEFNLDTYEIEPALAKSWKISKDGKTYTFQLRQGVQWSDGKPLTADDVIFTYKNILMNPEARANDIGNFKLDGKDIKIKKLNQYSIQFQLPKPAPAFLLQQRHLIMPKHKLLKYSIEGKAKPSAINKAWPSDTKPTEIVTSGPFRLKKYVSGQKVTLVKNPKYWKVDAKGKALPYLDKLEFLIVRDAEAQIAQFLAGNVDQINITGAQFPDLKQKELAGGPFHVGRYTALFNSPPFVAYNFDSKNTKLSKLFSDSRFRRAMQKALNRQRMIEVVNNGLASMPGHGVAPANKAFYFNTTKQLDSFQLAAANKALDKLGLRDSNKDGIRDLSGGEKLEFDLTYGTDSAVYPAIATIIQNDFAKIGIKVNLKGVLSNKLFSTGMSGNWEMILAAFGDQPDPELRKPIWQPGGALYYWHRSTQPKKEGQKPNIANMQPWEKEIYKIFEKASVTTNPAERKKLYIRWQKLFAQHLPVTPLYKPHNLGAISKKYGNYIFTTGVIPGYNPIPLIYKK